MRKIYIPGLCIKVKRETEGLTLAQAAEQIGVSASTLSRLENELFPGDIESIDLIAKWLGITIHLGVEFPNSREQVEGWEAKAKLEQIKTLLEK